MTISRPSLTLRDGDVLFCAVASSRLLLYEIDFCASLVPQWQQEFGALYGRQMQLVSVGAPGFAEKYVEMTQSVVNRTVLPALDGVEVYQTDAWIGRQIVTVRVMPGKVDLQF